MLLLGNYPPPYGGVPRYIEHLAPYLVSRGWDVHVLSLGRTGIERHPGYTVYKLPWRRKAALVARHALGRPRSPIDLGLIARGYAGDWAWYQVAYSVGREIVRANRIQALCGFNLYRGGLVGAMVAHATGLPLVVNNFGELFSHEAFFRDNPDILPFICRTARRFVSGSRHCASGYARFGLAPEVEVIPYGVDTDRFRPEHDGVALRARLGAGPDTPIVLFVGRFVRDMGLHTVLTAIPPVLERQPEVRFLLVGAAGELSADAAALVARYPGHVLVRQDVAFDELPACYAASDFTIAPTAGHRACSSLASAEALATGKPVIASRVGGIPEVVAEGSTGRLIPPEDAAALADAVLELAGRPDLRREMGCRGRAWIEAHWDTRAVLARMEEVFTEVVEEPA